MGRKRSSLDITVDAILFMCYKLPAKLAVDLFNGCMQQRMPIVEDLVGPVEEHIEPVITVNVDIEVAEEEIEELPDMCQIFVVDSNTCVGVQFVNMCPEETAHIRIIGETAFSKLYKRRVCREKGGKRYFTLNNIRYYLSERKTPIIETAKNKEK